MENIARNFTRQMKKICGAPLMLVMSLSLLTTMAFASNETWQLKKKISGPAPFECGKTLDISENGTDTLIQSGVHNYFFYSVNQGQQCRKNNASHPYGGMSC